MNEILITKGDKPRHFKLSLNGIPFGAEFPTFKQAEQFRNWFIKSIEHGTAGSDYVVLTITGKVE